jgi:hypothetical protein
LTRGAGNARCRGVAHGDYHRIVIAGTVDIRYHERQRVRAEWQKDIEHGGIAQEGFAIAPFISKRIVVVVG